MSPNAFEALAEWFAEHCNGEWEHGAGIRIETLDNPGWTLGVELAGTPLEGKTLASSQTERDDDDDWVAVRSDGTTFTASGGPLNLGELAAAFARFAGVSAEAGGTEKSP